MRRRTRPSHFRWLIAPGVVGWGLTALVAVTAPLGLHAVWFYSRFLGIFVFAACLLCGLIALCGELPWKRRTLVLLVDLSALVPLFIVILVTA